MQPPTYALYRDNKPMMTGSTLQDAVANAAPWQLDDWQLDLLAIGFSVHAKTIVDADGVGVNGGRLHIEKTGN